MNTFMRDSDAFAWYMERDPTLRATIVAVAWLEQSPDWDQLVANLERAVRVLPMFHRRVVERPGRFATPQWVNDDEFDLSRHLRRVESTPPHDAGTVLAIARHAATTAFDHAHALWEFTLVEQLEGERAALVMKIHHALTDGIGGMQLALELFDLDALTQRIPNDGVVPGEIDAPRERGRVGAVTRAAQSAGQAVWRAAHHPAASATESFGTLQSIARTLAPVSRTLSPIMTARSVDRQLDIVEVQLGDIKRAAVAAGGSINDAFMAAVTGGLRLYHERNDAPVEELRVTLPINIRTPDDPPGGNRITLMRFAVRVSDPDPASRIRALGPLCRAAAHERSIRYTGAIAGVLNLLPRSVVGDMLKHVDFVASDIPGYAHPIFLAGARVQRYVVFAPTTGTAVNLALLSYDGNCCVGVSSDAAAVADPEVLIDCIRQGFEEVLALGGTHAPAQLPLRADAGRSAVRIPS